MRYKCTKKERDTTGEQVETYIKTDRQKDRHVNKKLLQPLRLSSILTTFEYERKRLKFLKD